MARYRNVAIQPALHLVKHHDLKALHYAGLMLISTFLSPEKLFQSIAGDVTQTKQTNH